MPDQPAIRGNVLPLADAKGERAAVLGPLARLLLDLAARRSQEARSRAGEAAGDQAGDQQR